MDADLHAGVTVDAPSVTPCTAPPCMPQSVEPHEPEKTLSPTGLGLMTDEAGLACGPGERSRFNFGVDGACPTECLAAPGTMAASCTLERRADRVVDASTEAATRQNHAGTANFFGLIGHLFLSVQPVHRAAGLLRNVSARSPEIPNQIA